MALDDILRKTLVVGICTKLIFGFPNFSTSNQEIQHHLNPLQTTVAYAESQSIEQVTDETYEEKVCKSEKPTAVFFTADNDDPSFEYARSVFEKIVKAYPKKTNYLEYNLGEMTVDEINSKKAELFEKYGVYIIPSIAYGRKGKIIGVFSALPVEDLTKKQHEYAILFSFDPKIVEKYDLRSLEQYKERVRKENKDLLDFE